MEGIELGGDQQFCLRWNNFQANITSQFEALRDDEDFVDVTLACEGHRLEAHKVVLSACSPFFKELFKNNPCPHPIVFMRDCEAVHIRALLDFMYAGQVNIAQTQLPAFLRTAEALQIRGLTDASPPNHKKSESRSPPSQLRNLLSTKHASTSRIDSPSPTLPHESILSAAEGLSLGAPKSERDDSGASDSESCGGGVEGMPTNAGGGSGALIQPKFEQAEQEDYNNQHFYSNNALANPFAAALGNPETMSGISRLNRPSGDTEFKRDTFTPSSIAATSGVSVSELGRIPDDVWWEHQKRSLPFSVMRDRLPTHHPPKLIKLGDGVEVREEQLRGVKWGDFRKVTRGLAAALFSPAELATCSVTGQRWSRAGQESRPTKPPLDRRRVHALISYVSNKFPEVEVSRIKQVLAYKCKENCAAFRMRAATEGGSAGLGRPPAPTEVKRRDA